MNDKSVFVLDKEIFSRILQKFGRIRKVCLHMIQDHQIHYDLLLKNKKNFINGCVGFNPNISETWQGICIQTKWSIKSSSTLENDNHLKFARRL